MRNQKYKELNRRIVKAALRRKEYETRRDRKLRERI